VSAVIAYVGLGSNLEDPARQVRQALDALERLPGSRLLRRSSLYRTAPWGYSAQPDFVNAVAEMETRLTPRELLDGMLDIERGAGRIRDGGRWGPRVIDLDLLVFGDRRIAEQGLEVPHPRMAGRAFVVFPLAELAPDLELPGIGRVSALSQRLDPADCVRMS
jgi:2-amino-4-hydroxy-6-hydroxymethyldihydropteridine diphosphokinase